MLHLIEKIHVSDVSPGKGEIPILETHARPHAVGSPPRPVTPNSRPTTPASESPLGDVSSLVGFFRVHLERLRSPRLGKWQEIWNDYNSIMFFFGKCITLYLIQRVTLWKWWVLSLNPGVLFWNCRENIGFCWLFGTRTEPIFTPPILDPFELRNFVLVWQSSYKTWTLPGFQVHPTFLADHRRYIIIARPIHNFPPGDHILLGWSHKVGGTILDHDLYTETSGIGKVRLQICISRCL